MILLAPGARMAVAGADLEANVTIGFRRRVEIAHGMNDVIEAATQRRELAARTEITPDGSARPPRL